jgi:transposase
MLTLPSGARMFMATQPVDLRRSYDGLCAIVEGTFGRSARSGDLFVFINRRANQVRILFWDRDGYVVVMKRLEAGTFRRIEGRNGEDHLEIDAGELAMLLEGIDAPVIKRRKRYRMLEAATTVHAATR